MLLITVSPQLDSLALYTFAQFDQETEDRGLLALLRWVYQNPTSVPYLQNLRKVIFLPDENDLVNDGFHYIEASYYHRLNFIRRLPALQSVSFVLATWNNEAGMPPPPKSANYRDISFTHSNIVRSGLMLYY